MTGSAGSTALTSQQRLPRFLSQKRDFSGDGGLSHPPEEKETQPWFSGHDLASAQSRFSGRDLASKWASGYREARGPTSIYTKTTKHNNNNRSLTIQTTEVLAPITCPITVSYHTLYRSQGACRGHPRARMPACSHAHVPACPYARIPRVRMPACPHAYEAIISLRA